MTEVAELFADEPEGGQKAKPTLGRFVGWLANWKGWLQFQYLMRQPRGEFGYNLVSWASCDMDRAFERLSILADALEDAGCDNADILNHSRGPGPHVQGCWVVDLVLDKK